jgi:hypothetical protein
VHPRTGKIKTFTYVRFTVRLSNTTYVYEVKEVKPRRTVSKNSFLNNQKHILYWNCEAKKNLFNFIHLNVEYKQSSYFYRGLPGSLVFGKMSVESSCFFLNSTIMPPLF